MLEFNLRDIKDGTITGSSQRFGHAEFKLSALNRIEFNIHDPRIRNLREKSGAWKPRLGRAANHANDAKTKRARLTRKDPIWVSHPGNFSGPDDWADTLRDSFRTRLNRPDGRIGAIAAVHTFGDFLFFRIIQSRRFHRRSC